MRGFYLACAYIQRGAGEFANAQQFEPDGGAYDIHDGIYRAHFVEMDLLNCQLMDFCFGLG